MQSINLEISPLIDKFSKYEIEFMIYWMSIGLIAKILGAKIFGKFADKYSVNQALRICSSVHVVTGVFIVICSLTHAWFFAPNKFFYVVRFMQSSLELVALIFTAYLLFQTSNQISRIYISMLVPLTAGVGITISYYISYLINIYTLQSWYVLFIGISVLGFWCVMSGTKAPELRKNNISGVVLKLDSPQCLVFTLGAACVSAIFNISFCVDRFVKDSVIVDNLWYLLSSVSFYAYTLIALLPAAFIARKIGMRLAMQFGLSGAIVTILAIYLLPFAKMFFLVASLLHLFFVALFFVCVLDVLYDAYLSVKSYTMPIVWFTLGFAVFGMMSTYSQLLPLSLYAVGIISAVPGMLLGLLFLSTISNQPRAINLLFPISLGQNFVFKTWNVPAKVRAKISPVRFER